MKKIVLLLATVCVPFPFTLSAKDFPLDISFTGSLTYQGATWKDGMWPNVTGNLSEKWIGFSPAVQVKYNQWKYQPTLEFTYSKQNYDFSNWEQPVAKFDTKGYRVLLGLTRDFKIVNIYLLGGISKIKYTPFLIETMPNPFCYHGKTEINETCPVLKFGVYRTWTVWMFRVGPDISSIYEFSEGVERCRDIKLNPVAVNAGMRIQW